MTEGMALVSHTMSHYASVQVGHGRASSHIPIIEIHLLGSLCYLTRWIVDVDTLWRSGRSSLTCVRYGSLDFRALTSCLISKSLRHSWHPLPTPHMHAHYQLPLNQPQSRLSYSCMEPSFPYYSTIHPLAVQIYLYRTGCLRLIAATCCRESGCAGCGAQWVGEILTEGCCWEVFKELKLNRRYNWSCYCTEP